MPIPDAETTRRFDERVRRRSPRPPATQVNPKKDETAKRSVFRNTQNRFGLIGEEAEDPRFFDLIAEKVQLDREIIKLKERVREHNLAEAESFGIKRGFTALEVQHHHSLRDLLASVLEGRRFKQQLATYKGQQ